MRSLNQGLIFAESLAGRSCIVSRFRTPKEIERPMNYFTLHQLVYKVLRKQSAPKELHSLLAGEEMIMHVKKALREVFQRDPLETEAVRYYYLIRSHKNHQPALLEDPFGKQVLASYQTSLSTGLDYCDSLQMASWALDRGKVDELYSFPYENIILIQPEILKNPEQTAALDFFISFQIWIEHYTQKNIYVITDTGHISSFSDSFLRSYSETRIKQLWRSSK